VTASAPASEAVGGEVRALLELLEQSLPESGEAWPALAYLAGRGVTLDEAALHAATRRALLLLAAGGDPTRDLDRDGRAVRALAEDIDGPGRRAELTRGVLALRRESAGLEQVEAALDTLLDDGDRAWRSFACSLLAEKLADDDEQ
jgi:hypothetical protein